MKTYKDNSHNIHNPSSDNHKLTSFQERNCKPTRLLEKIALRFDDERLFIYLWIDVWEEDVGVWIWDAVIPSDVCAPYFILDVWKNESALECPSTEYFPNLGKDCPKDPISLDLVVVSNSA
jgi:hypothetical protein